jgi:predicted RNA methylase
MTKDDIKKMLETSGMDMYGLGMGQGMFLFYAERFAKFVVEAERERQKHVQEVLEVRKKQNIETIEDIARSEREACITLIENFAQQYHEPVWAFDLVKKIRERGGHETR